MRLRRFGFALPLLLVPAVVLAHEHDKEESAGYSHYSGSSLHGFHAAGEDVFGGKRYVSWLVSASAHGADEKDAFVFSTGLRYTRGLWKHRLEVSVHGLVGYAHSTDDSDEARERSRLASPDGRFDATFNGLAAGGGVAVVGMFRKPDPVNYRAPGMRLQYERIYDTGLHRWRNRFSLSFVLRHFPRP
jgi:hypothetical protein